MHDTGTSQPTRPCQQYRAGTEKTADLDNIRSRGEQKTYPSELSGLLATGPAAYALGKLNKRASDSFLRRSATFARACSGTSGCSSRSCTICSHRPDLPVRRLQRSRLKPKIRVTTPKFRPRLWFSMKYSFSTPFGDRCRCPSFHRLPGNQLLTVEGS